MTYHYTHRLLHPSVLIREVSLFLPQMAVNAETQNRLRCRENETMECPDFNRMSISHLSFTGSGIIAG